MKEVHSEYEEKLNKDGHDPEYALQTDRIKKILDATIEKMELVLNIIPLLQANGSLLREHLDEHEVDFILLVCRDELQSKVVTVEHPEVSMITDMLNKIEMYEKKNSRKRRSFMVAENNEAQMNYVLDLLFSKPSIVKLLKDQDVAPDPLVKSFLDSMIKLRKVMETRLSMSAMQEVEREFELKQAYRSSVILTENIKELEGMLERQREELTKDHSHKEALIASVQEKIDNLRENAKADINKLIYDSETIMMKDYIKSSEAQVILAEDAKQSTEHYQALLEEHLNEEKVLRTKRYKIETQLASWLAKYDQDIGEKQAEFEDLENTYNKEKEEYDALKEKLDEQEDEYHTLMQEKEEEEQRIFEERAYQYLMNRSARKIQRYWRAYRVRKAARKRRKKKGGSAKKGGRKKSPKSPKSPKKSAKKEKKKEETTTLRGGPDPNAIISSKFDSELLADIQQDDAFAKKDVVVDLISVNESMVDA